MKHWLMLGYVALISCEGNIGLVSSPVCDGERQAGEEPIDSPFDRDGDGAFDGDNPGCLGAYDPSFIDCDDTNPTVSPSHDEVLCNDLDDDCDPATPDVPAEGCMGDPNGTWDLSPTPQYNCAFGNVDINLSQISLESASDWLTITDLGSSSQPGVMSGMLNGNTFLVERTITGTCDEHYRLNGFFTSGTEMSATFSATFSGSLCFDCSDQEWPVQGTLN